MERSSASNRSHKAHRPPALCQICHHPKAAMVPAALITSATSPRDFPWLLALSKAHAGISIGVVIFLTPPESVDKMIELPDNLMYAAKTSGKNRSRFDENMENNSGQRTLIRGQL
jgi:predicted signal transduction protein with EAL and GGDEF domain